MKAVALGALSFAIGTAIPALVLPLAALLSQSPRRPTLLDDFLVAAYLAALSSLLATVGFFIPTALGARWRRLPASRATVVAGILGVVAPVASLLVAALISPALLPLFRSAPGVAIALFHGFPGVLLGIAALVIAGFSHPPRPPAG